RASEGTRRWRNSPAVRLRGRHHGDLLEGAVLLDLGHGEVQLDDLVQAVLFLAPVPDLAHSTVEADLLHGLTDLLRVEGARLLDGRLQQEEVVVGQSTPAL